jgi:NAD(P)-dependent dehydrogenase (short-subunit alcohol dehydrogenase family)
MQRFEGAHVLVTGGGSGIGRATAHRFGSEGAAKVAIVDHFADRLDTVVDELEQLGTKPVPIVAELAEPSECERVVTSALGAMGKLDVCVSNAGAWAEESFLGMELESWNRVLAVNLTASFLIGQLSARAMAESGGGVILYTASISSLGGSAGFSAYNITKAGIANLVATMAMELAEYGIRVNCVSPGWVDTQQSVDISGEEVVAGLRASFPYAPIKRMADPVDIAATFAFLASKDAAYITGVNLVVDGGMTAAAYPMPDR